MLVLFSTSDKDSYPIDIEKDILGGMAKSLGKSPAAWVPQLEVLPPAALEPLRAWWQRTRRGYPDATLKPGAAIG